MKTKSRKLKNYKSHHLYTWFQMVAFKRIDYAIYMRRNNVRVGTDGKSSNMGKGVYLLVFHPFGGISQDGRFNPYPMKNVSLITKSYGY